MTTARDWTGRVGDSWAAEWRRTDRSFAALSTLLDPAILAAAPIGNGRAVDLGCGAGTTSIALATARPELTVVGIDLSADLVRIATTRAPSPTNPTFAVADLNQASLTVAADADLLF